MHDQTQHDLLLAYAVFVPLRQLCDCFLTFLFQSIHMGEPSPHTEEVSKLVERHSFFLVMLSIESEHIFVLADEIVVKIDVVLTKLYRVLLHRSRELILVTCDSGRALKLRYRYLVVNITQARALVGIRVRSHYCRINLIQTFQTFVSSPFYFAAIFVMILLQLLVTLIHESGQQTFQSLTLILDFALAEIPLTEVKVVRIWIHPFICLLGSRLSWTCYSEGVSTFVIFSSSGAHVSSHLLV